MASLARRVFVQNAGLKLLSLVLAIALWRVVSRDPAAEMELRVPIVFRNFPDSLEIDSASYTEAQIRVRGPGRAIHRLRAGDVRAEIDLAGARPGSRTFDLTSRNIHVPDDLEVVQIIPSQFQLSFDDRMTRSIEVRPRVTGVDDRRAKVIADPPNITIVGPRHRVEAVDAATTDLVDANGTIERGSFVTQAYVPDPLIQVIHPTPIRVTVIMESSDSH
jgi:YbbR domain-containing protein